MAQEYLSKLVAETKWTNNRSPIVWREPIDFGGLKMLIGDASDFLEYCYIYYGEQVELNTCELLPLCELSSFKCLLPLTSCHFLHCL